VTARRKKADGAKFANAGNAMRTDRLGINRHRMLPGTRSPGSVLPFT